MKTIRKSRSGSEVAETLSERYVMPCHVRSWDDVLCYVTVWCVICNAAISSDVQTDPPVVTSVRPTSTT